MVEPFVNAILLIERHWVVSFTVNDATGMGYVIFVFVTESLQPKFDVDTSFTLNEDAVRYE